MRLVASILGGATQAGGRTVTVPANTALGTYYLLACADDKFAVAEVIETNNCLAASTTVVVGRPDLTETSLNNPPAEVATGKTFDVTDTVLNSGTAAARTSTTRYNLSTDAAKSAEDVLLSPTRAIPTLEPRVTSSGTKTVTGPAATAPGSYRVLACADDLARVVELDETNNCLASTATVAVRSPDLVVSMVSDPPADAAPGAKFSVTDSTSNQGSITADASTTRYYLSLDAVRDGGDALLTGSRARIVDGHRRATTRNNTDADA